MKLSLDNIQEQQKEFSVIEKRLVIGNNTKPKYQLLNDLDIMLSNNEIILIPKGFVWDLSSVPRALWWALPPDGDFAIAYIIHDFLYENKMFNRAFCDNEMLIWAKASSGTKSISLRNIDNYTRYYGVRLAGWLVWNNYIKL
jgi:hypothetical protein